MKVVIDIVKNPLFHFFILGLLIYVLYGLFGAKEYSDSEKTIVVTPAAIEWMADSWEKRWNRPPTDREMEGLINQYVRESILYQEALELGLDKNDVILRRRLAQKLEFLTDDLINVPLPSEEELETYFKENIDKYASPALTTFTHIFFDPDKRDNDTLSDAEKSKEKLNKLKEPPSEPEKYGDSFMLQSYYPARSEKEIAKLFGMEFAKAVSQEVPSGQWYGPVLSGYGTHLVNVHSRIDSTEPDIKDVKDIVLSDWEEEKRQEINDEFYQNLISEYKVIIEESAEIEEPSEEELPQNEEKAQ